MKRKSLSGNYLFVGFVLFLIILDQITKFFSTNINLDFGIFAFKTIHNTGAIWGFFQNSNLAFIWISIIAFGILIYFYDSIPKTGRYFYLAIISGILGNLIDRLFRGFVLDFIDFKFWPVFNLADSMIVIGVIGLIIIELRNEFSKKK